MKPLVPLLSIMIVVLAFLTPLPGGSTAIADSRCGVATGKTDQEYRPVGDFFRPAPYFVNGQLRGFRLYPGASPELFSQLGLQMGDLATEADGEALTDPGCAIEQLQKLEVGLPIVLLIEQNGASNTVEVQPEKVPANEAAVSNVAESRSAADVFRPSPYFVNGKIYGYRLYPGADPELLGELGLEPGDLVREIDGQPLTDAGIAYELLKELAKGTTAVLAVERDGSPIVVETRSK
jgi:type II secretory pathway component PulC